MHWIKARIGRLALYVAIFAVALVSKPAETQSGRPTANSGNSPAVSTKLSRSQESHIERALRDVDRLQRDLARARQKLMEYRRAAASETSDGGITPVGATVSSVSSSTALTDVTKTVGFDTGDSIVFLRNDANGNQLMIGVGEVVRAYENYLCLHVSATGNSNGVAPDDRVFVIGRDESPSSLANYKFAR